MVESSYGLAVGRRTLLGGVLAVAAGSSIRPALAKGYAGPEMIGRPAEYVVASEETLLDVARRYNLGVPEVSAANPGIDAWVPPPGQRLILPTAHILPQGPREGILVNVGELRLYLFRPDGSVRTYSIGVGRDGLGTPMGSTSVVRKKVRPTWTPTAETRAARPELPPSVPPGPDNPMGEHALYLGWPTYAIHGTNRPLAVGRRVSRGCVRLYPESIAELFQIIPIGTKVTVVHQTIKLARVGGEVWLQAKPELDQVDELEETYALTPKPVAFGDLRSMITARAGAEAARVDWGLVEEEVAARRGIPVAITGRLGELASGGPQAGTRPRTTRTATVPGILGLY